MPEPKGCPAVGHHYCFMYEIDLGDKEVGNCATGNRTCVDYGRVSKKDYKQHLRLFLESEKRYDEALGEVSRVLVSNIELLRDHSRPKNGFIVEIRTSKAAEKIVENYRPSEINNFKAVAEEKKLIDDRVRLIGCGDSRLKHCVYTTEAAKAILEKYRPELLWQNPLKKTCSAQAEPT